MNEQFKTIEFKRFIVLNARWTVEMVASKAALRALVKTPDFVACSEMLLDLRAVECEISASTIHQLVKYMAWNIPTLLDDHRIAILIRGHVSGRRAFDHAQFLELCAHTNGFHFRAYEDLAQAIGWLTTVLPHDLDHADFGFTGKSVSADTYVHFGRR